MKKEVTIEVWSCSVSDGDGISVGDLREVLALIPQEHQGNASLTFTGDDHDRYYTARISYNRPETDGERQKREREDMEWQARRAREKYEQELRDYDRLKAKFGG